MTAFFLSWKSMWNRSFTTGLTILSIALGVCLLLGVERTRIGVRESFSNTLSKTDLIVGARGGSLPLLLYTVFRMGNATNNISWDTYEKIQSNPLVDWTIPISLGDSHRGYRVVATTPAYMDHWKYQGGLSLAMREGFFSKDLFDVTLGSEVAKALGYKLGDKVALTHGVSEGKGPGILNHDDKPFSVVGILAPTGTPVDRSLYISLEGMEAIHIDWTDGAPPIKGQEIPAGSLLAEKLKPKTLTSFLVGTKSRIAILSLKRQIDEWPEEPLSAIIPGVTLSELWSTVSAAESGLQLVTVFVLFVSLMGMLVALWTSLDARRREMAILRAIGASPSLIAQVLLAESLTLALAGCLLGLGLVYGLLFALQPLILETFGLSLPLSSPTPMEGFFLSLTLIGAIVMGLLPAFKAYRNTLSDGLTLRV